MTRPLIFHRNVLALTSAQAFGAAGPPIVISLGGLVGQILAPYKALTTLPVSLYTVGLALATIPVSLGIGLFGRRSVYLGGAILALLAGLTAAYGIITGSFAVFCIGTVLAGLNGACVQTYRFAAVDSVPAARRAKAISLVMMGGFVAAIIGPQAVIWTRDALPGFTFAGSFLTQSLFALVSFIVLLPLQVPPATTKTGPGGRSLVEIARTPKFLLAAVTGMVSYGTMGFLMTAAPIAMTGCGHTIGEAALGIQWHVLSMFGPSLVTGSLIARFGEARVTLTGLLLIVLSGIVALCDTGLLGFWTCLILVGVGWNLGFVGATSMVAGCCDPIERPRVQGLNDLLVFATTASGSLLAGGLMRTEWGWTAVGWTAAALALAMGAVLSLAICRSRAADMASA
ncbi:MFS transporter [Bradyrhizobium sp. INPA01-394B]|uniref:MFS transporter n=1 Tax=Bradyrhizobium campsiandrae TaxID=1729892 RepID=A0ABR7U586_9BRAD|nr:MFS transporter [Bradyrhizobium campsiandrae]MBC9879899.1 MFS transporter [Bradyrhizobium campsiandrae]MBC9978584.1 MFS transporter [Bradyrhizobium campsiandrae]